MITRMSYSLSIDAVALEKSFRVGVGKAVVVPQGTGCLKELCLCCALIVNKETCEGKSNLIQISVQYPWLTMTD